MGGVSNWSFPHNIANVPTSLRCSDCGGVQVVQLGKGKIANQTDLEEGFVITKVDGKAVETVESLTGILAGRQGGVMLEGIYPDRPGTFYYAFGM